jgi:hypothetical protein
VIVQEAAPVLRRRSSPSHHLLGDRSLADFDAELKESHQWIRGAPQERVGGVHLPNQFTNLAIYRWSSGPRAPTPIAPKPLTVPSPLPA